MDSQNQRKILTVLLPFRNESQVIVASLQELAQTLRREDSKGRCSVLLVDSMSTDNSLALAKEHCEAYGWRVVDISERFAKKNPSVGRAIASGIDHINTPYLMILPCDCRLTSGAMSTLLQVIDRGQVGWGGFVKSYLGAGWIMKGYAGFQNFLVHVNLLDLVWTNGIFAKTELIREFDEIFDLGFVEEFFLSERLRGTGKACVIRAPIMVSPRRYQTKGTLKTIGLNAFIVTLFKLGFRNTSILSKLYRRESGLVKSKIPAPEHV